jgi:hypothetical protein
MVAEVSGSTGPERSGPTPRLRGAEALKAHVALGICLLVCAAAFWFELFRALGGNSLSWAYVFEWPLLAAFGAYMWWKVLHPGAGRSTVRKPTIAPEYVGMLKAWQEHQRQLAGDADDPEPSESNEAERAGPEGPGA